MPLVCASLQSIFRITYILLILSLACMCTLFCCKPRHTYTFSKLGHYGRLGNQLFQIASICGMAHANGDGAVFPKLKDIEDAFELDGIKRSSSIPESFDYVHDESAPTAHATVMRHNLKHQKSCLVDFRGYFQHQGYFKDIEQDIRKAFRFKQHLIHKVQKIIKPISIGVHCRRGDYEDLLDPSYFRDAVHILKTPGTKAHIIVCSDDIEWCKENLEFDEGDEVTFSPFTKPTEDMALLASCPGMVMSNSTFSWWSAWLGDHPLGVVAPWPWFGSTEAWKHEDALKWNDLSALIHPEWTVLHRSIDDSE